MSAVSENSALTEQNDQLLLTPQEKIPHTGVIISIIVPTRNEAGNIEPLLTRINQATKGIDAEVVFVDDSTDNTADVIRGLQNKYDIQVNLIVRPPDRQENGLGGAVLEGFHVARASWMCVMDADLQHPPELIPRIFERAKESNADIVVGSRLAPGGDVSSLGFKRTLISHAFAISTRAAFPVRLRGVTDPLSGFFIVQRSAINLNELRPDGFKILLEILVRNPKLQISELPIQFGYRQAGESKANIRETIRFFRLLLRLRLAGDQTFIRFLSVGATGLVVNSLVLASFTELIGLHYLLSAVFATQASTLWNFSLTEAWVFGKRIPERSFSQRLFSYLVMNNFLLLLRGPILSLLVAQAGIHYLISNLISLFVMTMIRYTVSNKWIWTGLSTTGPSRLQSLYRRFTLMTKLNRKAPSPEPAQPKTSESQPQPFAFYYNIHDILRIASMYRLPELAYFKVPELLEEPDIRLRLERRRRERRRKKNKSLPSLSGGEKRRAQRRSGNDIHYKEELGRHGFEISIAYKNRVEIAVSRVLRLSPHVLYTNVVEPILRWALVRKGYALVHAACIAVNGQAVLVTAQTDTGKTSTILRAVDNYAYSFLSDDMTIMSRDGKVMSYPKPLTISQHTLSSVGGKAQLSLKEKLALQIQSRLHSRSGRRIGLKISDAKLPAATMNTIVQMLIPPPKYMVDKLIPGVAFTNQAELARAVIIERGPKFEEVLPHDQTVKIFIRNAEDAYGFPPYPILKDSLSRWEDEDLHPQEQEIIAEALQKIPAVRLRDPNFNWWQRLSVSDSDFIRVAI